MNILVTGACGQLGCMIRSIAPGSRHRFIFADIAEAEGLETLRLDVTDEAALRRVAEQEAVDVIVNCAGYTNVDGAESEPELAERLNAAAPALMARIMQERRRAALHALRREPALLAAGYLWHQQVPRRAGHTGGGRKPRHPAYGMALQPLRAQLPPDDAAAHGTAASAAGGVRPDGDAHLCPGPGADHPPHRGRLRETPLRPLSPQRHLSLYGRGSLLVVRLCPGHRQCDICPCHSADYPTAATRPSYSVLDKTKIKKTFGIRIPHWTDSLRECLGTMGYGCGA